MPSPRSPLFAKDEEYTGLGATCETTSILFKTSATLLRNLFPNQAFSFKNRDTVTLASLRLQTLDNVPWLGGQGYNAIGLYIHDVVYTKRDGGTVDGTFLPVMFEDLADPILSGRDELGFPKLFSEINVKNEGSSISITCGWRGTAWGKMEVHGQQNSQGSTKKTGGVETLLVYRYVPGIGDPRKTTPDADYAASVQIENEDHLQDPPGDTFSSYEGASFKFDACDQHRFPTLYHIISRLAELPVFEIVEASVQKTEGLPTFSGIQRIE